MTKVAYVLSAVNYPDAFFGKTLQLRVFCKLALIECFIFWVHLRRMITHPKFDLVRVRTYDIQIMNSDVPEMLVWTTERSETFIHSFIHLFIHSFNTEVSRYNTTGILKKVSLYPDYQSIVYKFLLLCNGWYIDLVS